MLKSGQKHSQLNIVHHVLVTENLLPKQSWETWRAFIL